MDTFWPSLQTWETLSRLAPIATAVIALLAAGVAYRALSVQRDLARKRAASDFFLKTETDETIAKAYKATDEIRVNFKTKGGTEEIINSYDDLIKVTAFLNIFELMAVGIHAKIFDEDICFNLWGGNLLKRYQEWKPLIDRTRKDYGNLSYVNLVRLAPCWERRNKNEQMKQA